MRYVIIGNSAAAVRAIEGIRERDKDGEIIVISAERYAAYGRPLISYMLEGKVAEGDMRLLSEDFYSRMRVELRLSTTAEKIDTAKHTVTAGGETIKYDRLLIATGSRPFVPEMKGCENKSNVYTFMDMDNVLALKAALSPASRVVVIGGGLIGLKAAEAIFESGTTDITIVELAPVLLGSILDAEGATMVRDHLEKTGLKFKLGETVAEGHGKATLDSLTLTGGETIPCDILVQAVGVRPNTELAAEAGIKVGRGITVDKFMRTSAADVYAAGDVAETYDVSAGVVKTIPVWVNASMQGYTAGLHMASGSAPDYAAMPFNAINVLGAQIASAGNSVPKSGDYTFKTARNGNNYRKLVFEGDVLRGFILVGDIDGSGILTELIRSGASLGALADKLLDAPLSAALYSEQKRRELAERSRA